MSKQEAMEAIFDYLTNHDHPKQPATREIRVSGDDEGRWFIEMQHADHESRFGVGADFAEALNKAFAAPIC
jgi:hypothetical protein